MKPTSAPAWFTLLWLVLIGAGCASRNRPVHPSGAFGTPTGVSSRFGPASTGAPGAVALPPGQATTATDWRLAAGSWRGTPYRIGGNSRQGADCSGFAQSLYREVVGASIPRTTGELWQSGWHVGSANLRPGDLVFFSRIPSGDAVNHVGVVVGEGEFAHASTSAGVQFARYDRGYWQKRLAGARRYLR